MYCLFLICVMVRDGKEKGRMASWPGNCIVDYAIEPVWESTGANQ